MSKQFCKLVHNCEYLCRGTHVPAQTSLFECSIFNDNLERTLNFSLVKCVVPDQSTGWSTIQSLLGIIRQEKNFKIVIKIPIGVEEFGRKLLLMSPLNSEAVTFSRVIFYTSNFTDNRLGQIKLGLLSSGTVINYKLAYKLSRLLILPDFFRILK